MELDSSLYDFEINRKWLFQQVDFRLQFRDKSLQKEFYEFSNNRKMTGLLFALSVYFSILLFPSCLVATFFMQTFQQLIYSILFAIFALGSAVFCWILYFEKKLLPKYRLWVPLIQFLAVIFIAVCIIWDMYRKQFSDCTEFPTNLKGLIQGWHCSTSEETSYAYGISLLALYPIIVLLVLNEARVFSVILVSLLANVTFALMLTSNHKKSYVVIILINAFLQYFVCFELHIYRIYRFLTYRKLRETLLENKRMHEENRASELRSMIGNLAHDLKTPLSSFMTGIDMLMDTFHIIESTAVPIEANASLNERPATTKNLQSLEKAFDSSRDCFKNIRNTNLFMLMTINRCIDYIKASKGIKLTPKYETINLEEALSLPLDCMKNIQDRIVVELGAIDYSQVCTHIITDKQWLQENILCLVSNAVKYSTEGTVTIRTELVCLPEKFNNSSLNLSVKRVQPAKRTSSVVHYLTEQLLQFSANSVSLDNLENIPRNSRYALADIDTELQYSGKDHSKLRVSTPSRNLSQKKVVPIIGDEESTSPVVSTSMKAFTSMEASTASSKSMYLRFEVVDQGIGLSEEKMKQLFSPFQQAQHLTGGTGLGLYSLSKRIDSIKGFYGVQPRPDGLQGCMFWFEIPYRPDEMSANGMMENSLQRIFLGSNLQHGGMSAESTFMTSSPPSTVLIPAEQRELPTVWDILLVDDSIPIIKMTSMMLRHQGHTVTVAENGENALKKIWHQYAEQGRGFDVILMDLQMPIMDGLEATRRLREWEDEKRSKRKKESEEAGMGEEWYGEIKKNRMESKMVDSRQEGRLWNGDRHILVGMSANSDYETMEEAYRAGVDDFLSKPFQMGVFKEKVFSVVRRRSELNLNYEVA